MITNEVGEPLGIEILYDDEPDTVQDGFPYETDLGDEWR